MDVNVHVRVFDGAKNLNLMDDDDLQPTPPRRFFSLAHDLCHVSSEQFSLFKLFDDESALNEALDVHVCEDSDVSNHNKSHGQDLEPYGNVSVLWVLLDESPSNHKLP